MDQEKEKKALSKKQSRQRDTNDNPQNGRRYPSSHNGYFHPTNGMQHERAFRYPPPRGTYHSLRSSNPQFQGQQYFMQHQPFGGHNRVPFHSMDPRHPIRYPVCQFQNQPYGLGPFHNNQFYFDESFRTNSRPGFFNGQSYPKHNCGARPKTYKYNERSNYHNRNKKNRNNSSNGSNKNNTQEALVKNTVVETQSDDSLTGQRSEKENQNSFIQKASDEDSLLGLEGAVGGDVNIVNEPSSPLDKNMIDEGAICDFDRLFQRQEFLRNDPNEGYIADLDVDENNFLGPVECDSDMENCEYRLNADKDKINVLSENCGFDSIYHDSLNRSPTCSSMSVKCDIKKSSIKMVEKNGNSAFNDDNINYSEDTDDFIDTDLPLNNKHILSSSEDTSGSDNDEKDNTDYVSGSQKSSNEGVHFSDFNCNDLSMDSAKFTGDYVGFHLAEDSHMTNTVQVSSSQKCSQKEGFISNLDPSEGTSNHNTVLPLKILNNNDSLPKSFKELHSEKSEDQSGKCVEHKDSSFSLLSLSFHSHERNHLDANKTETHIATVLDEETNSEIQSPLDLVGLSISPEVNDLNAESSQSSFTTASSSSNVSDDGTSSNFSHDESNRQNKVFVKFPTAENSNKAKSEESCNSQSSTEVRNVTAKASGDSITDQLTGEFFPTDKEDAVDMVFLPMEEEIEPVHAFLARDLDSENMTNRTSSFASTPGGSISKSLQDNLSHLVPQDQNPLASGMPSKEFYELIKTVSTTENCIRFFDKDGFDIQRQPIRDEDDDNDGGSNSGLKVDRVMIWNEYEAYVMQYKQIAESACGPTAVLNVMKALQIPCDKSSLDKAIIVHKRDKDADIPGYLFSRSCAGTTAEELMIGLDNLSHGTIGGRFFHFWPPRKVNLLQWLAHWMNKGAIPVATLNLQQGPHSLWQIPDSWHHQMIYGVSPQGLYLTNPLEIVSERTVMRQICSDSVLKIKRQDVISRFQESTELKHLLSHSDPRWRKMNVLGQVVNILREFNLPSIPGYRLQVTSHISIPAIYKAGITLFMPKSSKGWASLHEAPELPLE